MCGEPGNTPEQPYEIGLSIAGRQQSNKAAMTCICTAVGEKPWSRFCQILGDVWLSENIISFSLLSLKLPKTSHRWLAQMAGVIKEQPLEVLTSKILHLQEAWKNASGQICDAKSVCQS